MDRTTVWGKVEDADGDAPPRTIVYWLDGGHKGPALPMDLHPVARTDQSGTFCAMDLPHGACKLAADCEAFGSGIRGGRSSLSMDVTIPSPKEDGELVLKYPFSRRQFARVHGSVKGKDDFRVLRGHKVVLVDPAPVNPGQRFLMETKTNIEGDYEFNWVPPGKYALVCPGTLGRVDAGLILDDLPAGVDVGMDIEVARRSAGGTRHTALVTCVDETGAPVPGAEVTVQAKNFHMLPILADEYGVARQGDIPVPLYAAVGKKAGYLDRGEMFNAAGAPPNEVRLVLRRLVTVRVVAVDDASGDPLRRARIAINHEGGMAENIDEILKPPKVITPDGGFDLQVLPGLVTIMATYPGYEMGQSEVQVPLGDGAGTHTLRLRPKAMAAGGDTGLPEVAPPG